MLKKLKIKRRKEDESIFAKEELHATQIKGGNLDKTQVYFSLDDFNISYEEMMKDVVKEQTSLDEMDLEK